MGEIILLHSLTIEISYYFGIDESDSRFIITTWLELEGLQIYSYKSLDKYFTGPRVLQTTWSPEIAQDVTPYEQLENAVIRELSNRVAEEINSKIFKELSKSVKTHDEFIDLMKNIGYTTGQTIYNPETFEPIKRFIRI